MPQLHLDNISFADLQDVSCTLITSRANQFPGACIPLSLTLKLCGIRLRFFAFSLVDRNMNGEFANPVAQPLILSSHTASLGLVVDWISFPLLSMFPHTRNKFSPANPRSCSSVAPRSASKATRSGYFETSYKILEVGWYAVPRAVFLPPIQLAQLEFQRSQIQHRRIPSPRLLQCA